MAASFEPVNAHVRADFDGFELDLTSGELIRGAHRVRLQGQTFQLLCVLLECAGSVVTREELQRRLWPGATFGDLDNGLNKAIAKLREALEGSKTSSKLIETIPRRGYRLNAAVSWVGESHTNAASEEIPAPGRRVPSQYQFAGGVLLALLIATAVWFNRHTLSEWLGIRPAIQSIAVLPLMNLSNDPSQEYLADGITEQLITHLSYAKKLRVLSRSSTIRFKGSHLSVPQIAEQLHVDALIEGSVLRSNDTVRVTLRLTAARPERQLWTGSYERKVSDLISLQNRLAADAVNQIRAQLSPEGKTQLELESQTNPEAYDEYLQAQFFFHQETTQKDKAIPHLERAIQLDPDFAAAYAAMGHAWTFEGLFTVRSSGKNRESYATALSYSQKAVKLDPTSSESFSSLGHSLAWNRRWDEAERAYRRAIELNPNNPYASAYLALLLGQKGRAEEGVQIAQGLAFANPVAIDLRHIYAVTLFMARRYDEAIAECERLIKLDPNHLITYGTYAQALAQKGRFQEAEAALSRSNVRNIPGFRTWLYALAGNAAAAREVLKENASSPDHPATAVAHYLLGEKEVGLVELDYLANQAWNTKTYFIRVDPMFDPMRNDPRFTEIVKKMGLLDN
jgi:TolB-like protein/DNA-binding winged helix-turn-helix (wHTH) protein/Flp pilus assembly protein TadD